MATQVQWRGGSTAEHSTFTGAAREITVDTQKKTLVVHDGSTAGGEPLLREDQANLPTSVTNGISVPSANNVAISTNGTGRLFVDASGNVGINTSPSSLGSSVTTLEIKGGSTTRTGGLRLSSSDSSIKGAFYIYDGAGVLGTETSHPLSFYIGNSPRMTLDTSGRLGLGSSSPDERLFVAGAIRSTSNSSNFAASDGLVFDYNTTDNTGRITAARTGANSSALRFYVYNSGSLIQPLHISSTGAVGIGTTSPGQPLTVNSTSTSSIANFTTNQSATNIFISDINTSANLSIGSAGNNLTFQVNGSERSRIDGSGRLLVGTSSARSTAVYGTPSIQALGDYQQGSIHLTNNSNSNANCGIAFSKIRGSSIVQSGDYLGGLTFNGFDGSADKSGATIEAVVDGTPGANDMPGRLVFSTTADGAASPTERMRIDSDGTVLIGVNTKIIAQTTNPFVFFQAQATTTTSGLTIESYGNNIATRYHFGFTNPNGVVGTISTNGSATAYNTSSDYRLKENIVPLTGAADRLNQLQVHRFNFIADPSKTVDGFLAHEAQAIVPECVTGAKDEVDADGNPVYQGIDQSKLVPLLTAALQEAMERIEVLEAKFATLESA